MPLERWLVTGASGQLGSHIVRRLVRDRRTPTVLALAGRHEVGSSGVEVRRIDLGNLRELRDCVGSFRPTHVLHVGALSAVGECYARPADADLINTEATGVLAEAAARVGARFVFSSTDMVFAGDDAPYGEADPPRPLSHYGHTKLAAERLLSRHDHALSVRLPLMYGFPCNGRATTFVKQIAALRTGEPLRLFTDEWRSPVWLADAARALIGLARSGLSGVIHVAGPERLSRYDLLARCAGLLGIEKARLVAASRLDIDAPEPRPADLSLDVSRLAHAFPELLPGPLRPAVFTTN